MYLGQIRAAYMFICRIFASSIGPEIITLFMLNSTELEISTVDKDKKAEKYRLFLL